MNCPNCGVFLGGIAILLLVTVPIAVLALLWRLIWWAVAG